MILIQEKVFLTGKPFPAILILHLQIKKEIKMKRLLLVLLAVTLLPFMVLAGGAQEDKTADSDGVSLILWDQYYRGVENDVLNTIVADFEAANPGIHIVREAKTLDDLKLVLQMTVQSGKGPDIMQLNQGEADMGAFVKADLISNLTKTAVEKGWESSFSKANLRSMGYKGDYYGVSLTGEVVGFFYNKAVFAELGLSIPKTFEDLEVLLADIKASGYTPINFGNLDGWTGIHEWSSIQHVYTTRDELDNMMSGRSGNFWNAAANKDSAAKLTDWVKKGYFTKDFSAIGYDDSATVFYQGKSALMLTGNWLQGEFDANAPFETGFFLMPAPAGKAKNLKAIGGPGIPFVINKKTKNQDAAVKFLDFLARKETAVLLAQNGMLPALPIEANSIPGASPLFVEILKSYKTVNDSNGMGYFIDWITPTFYDTSSAAVQELMAGSLSPADFAGKLQADYNNFIK